jgi:hypothetical protein
MGRSCFGGDLKLLFEFNRIHSLAATVLTRVRRAGSRLGDKALAPLNALVLSQGSEFPSRCAGKVHAFGLVGCNERGAPGFVKKMAKQFF